jgi:hypothetical protein
MTSDDIASRIESDLNGTPEHVADYMNSGRAAADLRELIRLRDEAMRRALFLRRARLAAERHAARLRGDLETLRARVIEDMHERRGD